LRALQEVFAINKGLSTVLQKTLIPAHRLLIALKEEKVVAKGVTAPF
jgi:uncharacterized protein (UPF0248 family)